MNISTLHTMRMKYAPEVPEVLKKAAHTVAIEPIPANSALENAVDIAPHFPHTYEKTAVRFTTGENNIAWNAGIHDTTNPHCGGSPLRVGIVLSGGQAPGGHNVIAGLYDGLQREHPQSAIFGFLNGPQGLVEGRYRELTASDIHRYLNTGGFDMIGSGRTKIESTTQMQGAALAVQRLSLDAVVIIGGDDSNTNAAVLAEYFTASGLSACVIGVPKTIDGDLKSELIEISFGFDTASKVYANLIGNIERDAVSAKKYWHFIKLMGRHASHITLECALQTHPNIALISEEIAAKKMTLHSIVTEIVKVIVSRAEKGADFGVVLIPEGIIEHIPEIAVLIDELNTALVDDANGLAASASFAEQLAWANKMLSIHSAKLFASLGEKIASGFLRNRDEHGNVIVSMIETETLIINMVKERLDTLKKAGSYTGAFATQAYFFGYEGRSEFPTNFDADYCYALGHTACLLCTHRFNGYIASIGNLSNPHNEWQPYGIPLTHLMTIETRTGKKKPVIKKSVVDICGKPFTAFAEKRDAWAINTAYRYPGPIQYYGSHALCGQPPLTLLLERHGTAAI